VVPQQLFGLMCQQTKLYAEQKNRTLKSINIQLIKKFLAFHIYTGIVKRPAVNDYFGDAFFDDQVANRMISRPQFYTIAKYFHLADNTREIPGDAWYRVRSVINMLNDHWYVNIIFLIIYFFIYK